MQLQMIPRAISASLGKWGSGRKYLFVGWLERDRERALGEGGIAYDQRARGIKSYV